MLDAFEAAEVVVDAGLDGAVGQGGEDEVTGGVVGIRRGLLGGGDIVVVEPQGVDGLEPAEGVVVVA